MTRKVLFTIPVGIYHAPGWYTGREREFKTTDDGMNLPDQVREVTVVIDPELEIPGMFEQGGYNGAPFIILREWDLRVVIHEIAHLALDHIVWRFDGTVEDLYGNWNHQLVKAVEVALAPIIHILAAEDATRAILTATTEPST